MKNSSAPLFLAFALFACGQPSERSDGGATPNRDGGVTVADGGPPATVPEEAQAQLVSATRALGAARGLAAPLVQDAQQLRDDPRSDRPSPDRRQEAEARVEDGVSGNSIVTEPTCVVFAWSLASLSVEITFEDCILEATGEPLDGMLSLTVAFGPTRFISTFSALQIGAASLDGSIELSVGGRCMPEDPTCLQCRDTDPMCQAAQQSQVTLGLDLVITSSTSTTLTFDALSVALGATDVTIDGAGMLLSTELSGTLRANQLVAQNGDCLPTRGSLDFDQGAGLVYRATFLPTTPATGAVYLQVNGFPPLTTPPPEVTLFPPCP